MFALFRMPKVEGIVFDEQFVVKEISNAAKKLPVRLVGLNLVVIAEARDHRPDFQPNLLPDGSTMFLPTVR